MKKLVLTALVVVIGLAPALVFAQTGSTPGPTNPNPAPSSRPGSPPGGSIPNTPGMPPAPPSGSPTTPNTTSPSTSSPGTRYTNKAECERAGGKWHGVQKKCDMGG
jgi:hypothetical protein